MQDSVRPPDAVRGTTHYLAGASLPEREEARRPSPLGRRGSACARFDILEDLSPARSLASVGQPSALAGIPPSRHHEEEDPLQFFERDSGLPSRAGDS